MTITEKCKAPLFYGKDAGRDMFMAYEADPRFTGFGWTEQEARDQLDERKRSFSIFRAA